MRAFMSSTVIVYNLIRSWWRYPQTYGEPRPRLGILWLLIKVNTIGELWDWLWDSDERWLQRLRWRAKLATVRGYPRTVANWLGRDH